MLTDQNGIGKGQLCLPPRLILKVTNPTSDDPTVEQTARREAIILTGLNTSSGSQFAVIDDYLGNLDGSYLFTGCRRLVSIGWSSGWLANDAAYPTKGIAVSQWIPGGQLLDVVCARGEYSEFAVMRWTQQLLQALRWLHLRFGGRPHRNIRPEHVLVVRRITNLIDVALTGFGTHTNDPEFDGKLEAVRVVINLTSLVMRYTSTYLCVIPIVGSVNIQLSNSVSVDRLFESNRFGNALLATDHKVDETLKDGTQYEKIEVLNVTTDSV